MNNLSVRYITSVHILIYTKDGMTKDSEYISFIQLLDNGAEILSATPIGDNGIAYVVRR